MISLESLISLVLVSISGFVLRILYSVGFEPSARFGEICRQKKLNFGFAKAFGEKGVSKIPPLILSDHGDFGDLLIVLDQKADIAPFTLSLPSLKIF